MIKAIKTLAEKTDNCAGDLYQSDCTVTKANDSGENSTTENNRNHFKCCKQWKRRENIKKRRQVHESRCETQRELRSFGETKFEKRMPS